MKLSRDHIIGTIALLGDTYWIVRANPDLLEPDSVEPNVMRKRLLDLARADIGREMQREVWLDVNPALIGVKAWCQAWYLSKLRQAGLTTATWRMGGAFPVPLTIVSTPKLGDMAYWHEPRQHGAMVESTDPQLVTIDGAQKGNIVARVYHHSGAAKPLYYSIDSLLA